uniref:Uncharacterized protein n=2 Tax=Oryza TaxID=4527 RepID=A0A0D3FVR6_9ORYZ
MPKLPLLFPSFSPLLGTRAVGRGWRKLNGGSGAADGEARRRWPSGYTSTCPAAAVRWRREEGSRVGRAPRRGEVVVYAAVEAVEGVGEGDEDTGEREQGEEGGGEEPGGGVIGAVVGEGGRQQLERHHRSRREQVR